MGRKSDSVQRRSVHTVIKRVRRMVDEDEILMALSAGGSDDKAKAS